MKIVGLILIGLGIALLLYVGYSLVTKNNRLITPVPTNEGVKVIFVTPAK